jgi:hypothetical protein
MKKIMKDDIAKLIIKKLDDIELRLTKIEGKQSDSTKRKNAIASSKTRKPKRAKIDLVTPIKKLIENGFFKDWKTDNDVVKKLRQQVLNSKRASVSNVLRRLASAKQGLLQRDGEGTKKYPWRYKEKS